LRAVREIESAASRCRRRPARRCATPVGIEKSEEEHQALIRSRTPRAKKAISPTPRLQAD
jgi:hypothetical protein